MFPVPDNSSEYSNRMHTGRMVAGTDHMGITERGTLDRLDSNPGHIERERVERAILERNQIDRNGGLLNRGLLDRNQADIRDDRRHLDRESQLDHMNSLDSRGQLERSLPHAEYGPYSSVGHGKCIFCRI